MPASPDLLKVLVADLAARIFGLMQPEKVNKDTLLTPVDDAAEDVDLSADRRMPTRRVGAQRIHHFNTVGNDLILSTSKVTPA